jgi:creatinine amidohydrolase/Fe(II)-dependent formamide hydrolase-like protein
LIGARASESPLRIVMDGPHHHPYRLGQLCVVRPLHTSRGIDMHRQSFGILLIGVLGTSVGAQVRSIATLNTQQIAALDRSRTAVFLTGGMLEEHGPYLPAYTDGFLSERLTDEITARLVRDRPGWTALRFPTIGVGASGYNEIGRRPIFPGTYAVRPSTLRAMYMDLATELGEQGFRWIFVVHVHGSPLHITALDDAGDFFRESYGGVMVNLWGLNQVLGGWGGAMGGMSADAKRDDGLSLHAGTDEHSLMLYLKPELVAPGYRTAPRFAGANYDSSFAVAQRPEWPGYVGAPRHATRELGEAIWRGFSDAAANTMLEIIDGTRAPTWYRRYADYLRTQPLYRQWIAESMRRDSVQQVRQAAWRPLRDRTPP